MYYQGEYGSVEVWYVPEGDPRTREVVIETPQARAALGGALPAMEPGWYWWACLPGCLPDGDRMGPYTTEEEAVAEATAWD